MTNTISLTQPIRIPFDARSERYRKGILLAYPGLFLLMAGDAVRYSIGWLGWGIAIALGIFATVVFLVAFDARSALRRTPEPLALLLLVMGLSLIWSQYRPQTLLSFTVQIGATLFGYFLVNQFGWRQLLNILGNTIRFILLASLLFELYAAFTGPVEPIFPNYEGEPPASAYLWSQGNLFEGERIQGIVGNANLIAFIAVLGMLLFVIEFIVTAHSKIIPALSFGLALSMALLAQSAGMIVATLLVSFAAAIAIIAEGKESSIRRRIYARAIAILIGLGIVGAIFQRELFELLGRSPDASGRFEIWQKVFSLVLEKPIEGWGWIGYWIPGVEPWEGLIEINSVPMYQAHNALLDIWVQLGVVGLVAMIWLLLQSFVRLWHIAVRHTSPLYLYPLFIFLVIAAQSLTESRLLIEISWVLLVVVSVKSREGFTSLEPMGTSTKLSKLARSIRRALGRSKKFS
jgi:exopolysaccharide production protein ExoQ